MKRLKVGLNGFGRIGRAFARIAFSRDSFDIVAVNTRKTAPDMLAYLLQHDSVYRKYEKKVMPGENEISVDGKKIVCTQIEKPEEIMWEKYEVDVVIDATGAFTKKEDLLKHVKGTVKKVLLTAPAKDDETPQVVLGVNDDKIDWAKEQVISNASCTTNCTAPMFKILHENFNVLVGYLTTVHAYTQSQSLTDDPNKNFDRSRAAPLNIIPSTTGAARAVVKTIPELKGKIDGMAIRVPVATGSFSDITVLVEKKTTVEEVNQKFKEASEAALKNILHYETEVLVSSDYIGSPYSCIFDANYTKVVNEHLIKAFGWYDNEWGYSSRLADMVEKIAQFI
ncbi:MAG: type I glyceraldehyde-3-phosphate dehydrogenase [Candidatus Roizmanbacteria bacterium]|nr:MAG: type I glyceraldehyde-3-phosphate dehydrogenase [Candidatus Roizmanbacteria bacterium]